MLEFMHTWITNIAVIIIFTSFLEMLMPNGEMKRYIRVVIGLLVLLVIVRPFVMLKDIDQNFKKSIIDTSSYLDGSASTNESESITKYQKEKTIEIYENNLKSQIKHIVLMNRDIDEKDVAIDLEIDSKMESTDFGQIKSLNVELSDGNGLAVEVNKVESISINKNKKVINEEKSEYNFNDEIESQIRTDLSNFLGISKSNIQVNFKKGE